MSLFSMDEPHQVTPTENYLDWAMAAWRFGFPKGIGVT